jgi:hypothetical protein
LPDRRVFAAAWFGPPPRLTPGQQAKARQDGHECGGDHDRRANTGSAGYRRLRRAFGA